MQDYVSPSSEAGLGYVLASPSCPTCKLGMRVVQTTSIAFSPDLVDVSYTCDECGRRTQRTTKGN
jgi:transposase-like protein